MHEAKEVAESKDEHEVTIDEEQGRGYAPFAVPE